MIRLKRIAKQNPFAPEEVSKFYASAIHDEKSDIDSLASQVAERCSLQRSDVHGVLVALMDIIPENLLKGHIITLGGLGSFFLTVKSEGSKTEEGLTARFVKGVKIQYRPTKQLKTKVKMVDVSFRD